MTTFLGPVGSLIPVKCASQLTSSGGRQVAFQDTLGKRKAFLGKVRAREWQADIGLAKPQELSGLRWLAENVNTPMVWYGPDAVVGNILVPQVAGLAPSIHNGLEGPLIEVEPGTFVKSAFPDGSAWLSLPVVDNSLDNVPVIPGKQITVAAWMRGSNRRVNVVWRDHEGTSGGLGNEITSFGDSDELTRCAVTLVVPDGAVQISLQFGAAQSAGPTITLTDRLMPYSPGKGAKRVVAHGLSESLILVTQDKSISSASFTISEVG